MTNTITIGAFGCSALTAQPFAYEGEAQDGLTARAFTVSGLLTPSQWQGLLGVYDTWRNLRITDDDTLKSGTTGSTVSLTISSTNGVSVSGLACWFSSPPEGQQFGAYINATAVLVDAAQALQVLLRRQEKDRERGEALVPNLGTVTFGSAVVTLTAPMDTRRDGPQVSMTATGTSLVSGPFRSHKVRDVVGYISSGTYSDLLAWYDSAVTASPSTGSWFPVTAPQATAEVIIDGGVKSTRYNVAITALQVL
jgi:hypothetical protein